jgi:Ketopantoate reductase PanE/ApbA
MPRYIILGAGAIGGAIGGRLALAARSVVLVARGDHLVALRECGLRLRTPDEDVTQRLPAIGSPDEIELDVDDILILATKAHQANEALAQWTDAPVHQNVKRSALRVSACRSSLRSMASLPRASHIGTSGGCTEYVSGCRPFICSRAR